MNNNSIKQYFSTNSNINLNDNWLNECINHINNKGGGNNSNNNNNIGNISEKVYKYFLISDICKSAIPCLDSQNKAINDLNIKVQSIKGVYILQLNSIKNISEPFETRDDDDNSTHRTLKLHLTDGKNNFQAIEHTFIRFLTPKLTPGIKVAIKDFTVRRGVILLDEHNIRIVGGHVTRLVQIHDKEVKIRKDKLAAVIPPIINPNNPNPININNNNNNNNINNNNIRSTVTPTTTITTIIPTNNTTTTPLKPTLPSLIKPSLPIKPSAVIPITTPVKPINNNNNNQRQQQQPISLLSPIQPKSSKDTTPISLLSPPQSLISERNNQINGSGKPILKTVTTTTTTTTTTIDLDSDEDDLMELSYPDKNNNNQQQPNNHKPTLIININDNLSKTKSNTRFTIYGFFGEIKLNLKQGQYVLNLTIYDGSSCLEVNVPHSISEKLLGDINKFRTLKKQSGELINNFIKESIEYINGLLIIEFKNIVDGFQLVEIVKPLDERRLINQFKSDLSGFSL